MRQGFYSGPYWQRVHGFGLRTAFRRCALPSPLPPDFGTGPLHPEGTAIVCNVCMPGVSKRLAKENNAALALDMPPEAKARLVEIAQRRRVPVEALIKLFYTWRTVSMTDATVVNLLEKKKAKR